MRSSETFTDFYTRFLHLAGEGKIPEEDLRPDLYDKLTIDLQRAIAPTEAALETLQEFQKALRRLDQNLRQIQERSSRFRTRNPPKEPTTDRTKPLATADPALPPANRSRSREATPGTLAPYLRPLYSDPRKQALSNRGACFACGQDGHIARECPVQSKKTEVALVLDDSESEKE